MLCELVFAEFVSRRHTSTTSTVLSTASLYCTSSMCLAPHKSPDADDVYWVSTTSAKQRSNLRMGESGFLASRRPLENLVLLLGATL